MLSAIREDLTRIPGVGIFSLPQFDASSFRAAARAADYTLVIAPEFDDLLLTRCRWIEEVGGCSLGPSSDAVQLAGDKLALARHLRDRDIATPESWPGPPAPVPEALAYSLVWKPRYGAGSTATFLIRHEEDWDTARAQAEGEGWTGESLVQPFVPGFPVSVAFLTGPREWVVLPATRQQLSPDGRFRYQGGELPLPGPLNERATQLARRALQTITGWCGYVGVDLVLGNAANGSQDWVIEVNPRLTTSYVGLRALAATNLAETMLQVAIGERSAPPRWRAGRVQFTPDGRVCGGGE